MRVEKIKLYLEIRLSEKDFTEKCGNELSKHRESRVIATNSPTKNKLNF